MAGRRNYIDKYCAADITPPRRIKTTTNRIVRDTEISKSFKEKYQACQICGKWILKGDGKRCVESHHIKPLGYPHNGPDVIDNIIVLCPNHHAEFDFGSMAIDPNNMTIISKDRSISGKELQLSKHQISKEYLEYHLRNICKIKY